jgi:hypothetical protein
MLLCNIKRLLRIRIDLALKGTKEENIVASRLHAYSQLM